MYNDYYGFHTSPFRQTPDSSIFFASDQHRSALAALLYGLMEDKGFVVVTGEIGSGKTTVTRTLLKQLDRRFKCALITNTLLTPKGVIRLIMEDLDIAYTEGSKDQMLIQLNEYLIQQAQENFNVVVIIDEAQNLSASCLEEVRMLSNLETEKEKLIQIVLVGQPELRKKLEMKRLEQLRQRIGVHYHLGPLSQKETKEYILHRLNKAKANGRDFKKLFSEESFSGIYDYARGLPRAINMICDHALVTGCLAESDVITPKIIDEAKSELRFSEGVRN